MVEYRLTLFNRIIVNTGLDDEVILPLAVIEGAVIDFIAGGRRNNLDVSVK